MTCDGMRPEDLATELAISGKKLRDWLRERFPRGADERGSNWYLTHTQVSMARRMFGPTPGGVETRSTLAKLPPKKRAPSRAGLQATAATGESAEKSAEEIVQDLQGRPVSVDEAQRPTERGGLPSEPGFYSWWTMPGAIEGVPATPHPDALLGLILFYVGIAPNGPNSSSTIRSRVSGNHLSGNTGSSTFRFTLAALLLEELDLHPRRTKTKVVLPQDENRRLSKWQGEHLRLTWCVATQPWLREDEVIAMMKPPLNLAANAGHAFFSTLRQARAAFRQAAGQ